MKGEAELIYLCLRREVNSKLVFDVLHLAVPMLMGIFIFLVPLPHRTTTQEICFYLSTFIACLLVFSRKARFSLDIPLSLPFLLFIIWAFLSILLAFNRENSFHDWYKHLLEYMAIFYLLVTFFNSKKRFGVLTWVIVISGSIFSIGGLIYFYYMLDNGIAARLGLPEVGIGVNYIGFMTIFAIFVALNHFPWERKIYRKIILTTSLVGASVATILTQTMGTFLGMLLPLFLLFTKEKKTLIVFVLCFMIMLAFLPAKRVFTLGNIQNKVRSEERISIWRTYIEVIKDNPITGIGYGMQTYEPKLLDKYHARVPAKYRMKTFHAPHNVFVDVAVRLGLVGLGLFFYIIFTFIRMGWKLSKYGKDDFIKRWALCLMAIFISYLIQGMFADLLLGVQAITLFVIFAMMTILWRLNAEPATNDTLSQR